MRRGAGKVEEPRRASLGVGGFDKLDGLYFIEVVRPEAGGVRTEARLCKKTPLII